MGVAVPTWADIVAILSTVITGAYVFGTLGQRVRTLEEKADRAEDLERDFHELTSRLTRLEVGLENVQKMLEEVRNALRAKL
jgi:hypothetical protein